jgi:hypothetical protein
MCVGNCTFSPFDRRGQLYNCAAVDRGSHVPTLIGSDGFVIITTGALLQVISTCVRDEPFRAIPSKKKPPFEKSHTKVWRIWNEIDCARPYVFPFIVRAAKIRAAPPQDLMTNSFPHRSSASSLPFIFPAPYKIQTKKKGGKFVSNVLFLRIYFFSHRKTFFFSLTA